MGAVRYLAWFFFVVSTVIGAFNPAVLWAAGLLLILAVLLSLFGLYRPPENHLGAIYRFDRFHRLIEPDDWTVLWPQDHVKCDVNLRLHRTTIELSDLLTRDQRPLDCTLAVYFRRDLRLARPGFLPEALQIPIEGWQSIVQTIGREVAMEVAGDMQFQHLLTPTGYALLRHCLSRELANRARTLGILISSSTGVSIQALKPSGALWKAMMDRLAAGALGEAALARVQPMFKGLCEKHRQEAWNALLLQWASALARGDAAPQAVSIHGSGWGPAGHPAPFPAGKVTPTGSPAGQTGP
jgi:regulator of protease activity HflC (stomatin/prohibitin superfamily)